MTARVIRTERLEIVPGTLELARAGASGNLDAFARMLGVGIPPGYPPPEYDQPFLDWDVRFHEAHPDAVGWGGWHFVLVEEGGQGAGPSQREALPLAAGAPARVLIGGGGFKGPPTPEGAVEIGYSLIPSYHGRGLGKEAVIALVAWAFEHHEVRVVIADTMPELVPSIRLLDGCGFQRVGPGPEERSIRFELDRAGFEASRAASDTARSAASRAAPGTGTPRTARGPVSDR